MDEQKPTPPPSTDEKLFPLYLSPLRRAADVGEEPVHLVKTAVSVTHAVILLSALIEACRWRAPVVYRWFMENRFKICKAEKAPTQHKPTLEIPEGLPLEHHRFWKQTSRYEAVVVSALNSDAFRRLRDQRGAHPKGTRRKAKLTPAESRALYTRLLPSCRKTATGRVKPETRAMEAVSRKAGVTVRTIRDYLKRT